MSLFVGNLESDMKTKLLDLLLFSEKRKNLIILLHNGPRTLTEIKQSLSVTSPGIIPQIRMLEQRNIVNQEGKLYLLTDKGRLLYEHLYPLIKIIDIIEKNENFIDTHDISIIPEHLLKRFHELGDCMMNELNLEELYEPHNLFLQELSQSNWIKGVTPVFRPSWPDMFLELALSGKEVSLILTQDVYKRAETEYTNSINEFLNLNNVKIFIYNNELKFSMIVTNCYFSITLFFKDGGYDFQRDWVSLDPSAISWGTDMLKYLLHNSHKV